MNIKTSVAICYPDEGQDAIMSAIRKRTKMFDCCDEYDFSKKSSGIELTQRRIFRPSHGYDLIIIVCDGTQKFTEYDLLKLNNGNREDPWATMALSVQSGSWEGPQPTIAIEAERYLGPFIEKGHLPMDLMEMIRRNRWLKLPDRGLSREELESLRK